MFEVQPWHVAAWRPIDVDPAHSRWMIRRLAPRACAVSGGEALAEGARGQVTWACETPDGPAGLSWDWLALRPRVLAMADPMNVVSNLRFVDDDGIVLPENRRIVELNNLIARLPWQARALHAMSRRATRAPAALPLAA